MSPRRLLRFDNAALLPQAWRHLAEAGPLHCFNPSLLADGEGWLFAYRVVGADQIRRIALCRLDPALQIVRGSSLPLSDFLGPPPGRDYPEQVRHWFADPRLYRQGGRVFLYWNSGWHPPWNHQFLQELDPTTRMPVGAARELILDGERQTVEKNWTLFGDDLRQAVYTPQPHSVLQAEEQETPDLRLRPVHVLDWDNDGFTPGYGTLRGGAPPQLLGGHYYSFCHSIFPTSLGYCYAASVYRFAATPPFRPTDAPARPLRLDLPDGTNLQCPSLNPATLAVIYPCGAAWRDGAWLISYGSNDAECGIAVLPAEEVEAAMKPLPPPAPICRTDTMPPDAPLLSVIVPVYREEANIRPFLARLRPVLEPLGSYEILFCLDPSNDGTEALIEAEAALDPRIGMLVFSRRFGQPAATLAGILHCRGAACVVIDVDLQDPPELIAELHAKWQEGHEVVLAQRRSRKRETWMKRLVAHLGYRLIQRAAEVPIPPDTGDFRLVTRRVIEELRRLPEHNGFLRGLVAYVGFRTAIVRYDRDERAHGSGHYNRFLGSLRIGLNGLFCFSTLPLSWLLWSGAAIAAGAGLVAILMLAAALAGAASPSGTALLAVLVLFAGGVQLAGLGLIGEYVGRIYEEARGRPRYIVARGINIAGPPGSDHQPEDRQSRGGHSAA